MECTFLLDSDIIEEESDIFFRFYLSASYFFLFLAKSKVSMKKTSSSSVTCDCGRVFYAKQICQELFQHFYVGNSTVCPLNEQNHCISCS